MKYTQQEGRLLGDFQPGQRVQRLLGRGDGEGAPDMGQAGEMLNVPDNPGPAVAGRTPLVGTLRRSNDMPVLRDQLSGALNQ